MYNVTINYKNGNIINYPNIETIKLRTDIFNRKFNLYFGHKSAIGGAFHQFHVNPKYVKSVEIDGYTWIFTGYNEIELQELFFEIVSFYRDKEVK